jgi:hypothetical protein
MYKYFIHIISVILTSFYFFPFETVALPGVNTKMVLAGVSLLILGKRLAQRRDADINKDFFMLSLWAMGVSLVSLVTMTVISSCCDSPYFKRLIECIIYHTILNPTTTELFQ